MGLLQTESKCGVGRGRDCYLKAPGGNYLVKDLSIFMNEAPDRTAFSKVDFL